MTVKQVDEECIYVNVYLTYVVVRKQMYT